MIKDKLNRAVSKAFDGKLADTVHSFICERIVNDGEFDYTDQKYSESEKVAYSGRGVLFGSYSKDYVKPADYQAEDAKASVLQIEIGAVPEIDDIWMTDKGDFRVLNVAADAADVLYICQLRKVTSHDDD